MDCAVLPFHVWGDDINDNDVNKYVPYSSNRHIDLPSCNSMSAAMRWYAFSSSAWVESNNVFSSASCKEDQKVVLDVID